MGFLINTEIHPFIKRSTELLKCQIQINKSDYPFLDHDSYIDCKEIYQFSDEALTDYRSDINAVTIGKIKNAVRVTGLLDNRYYNKILGGS